MYRWSAWILCIFFGCVIGVSLTVILLFRFSLSIDSTLSILSLAQLAVTLFLAFYIPLVLDRYRNTRNQLRELLIEHSKNLLSTITDIKETLTTCATKRNTSDEDKMIIKTKFMTAGYQLQILEQRLKSDGGEKCFEMLKPLKEAYFDYDRAVTGGSLYGNGNVDWQLWRQQELKYWQFQCYILDMVQALHKNHS